MPGRRIPTHRPKGPFLTERTTLRGQHPTNPTDQDDLSIPSTITTNGARTHYKSLNKAHYHSEP